MRTSMADTITYFGNPKRATFADGRPIVVNGRPLLIPENFDLQNEMNGARYAAAQLNGLASWFPHHYAHGSGGDPQRQAGYWRGFDPRYTDAGNYAFGLSAKAAGYSLDSAIDLAKKYNATVGRGETLPTDNENAIRQAYQDYQEGRFLKPDVIKGRTYSDSTESWDNKNFLSMLGDRVQRRGSTSSPPQPRDVERYALDKWGDLNSREAKAFMANFEQAFGSYPQHLDLDKLHPLPADGSIPSGKDVSLFVGRNGEVLYYEREPAPGGTGALRGIYGLDGAPGDTNSLPGVAGLDRAPKGSASPGLPDPGSGSTGMMFFEDGTPRPTSIRPHPTTPGDPTGGVDVTLKDGSNEHWWNDQIDGFIRSRLSPFDSRAPSVPFVPPSSVSPSPVQPIAPSPRSDDATQGDPRNIRVLARINPPGAPSSLPDNAPTSQQAAMPPALVSGQPVPDYPVLPFLFGLPDRSAASGDDMDDWYTRWVKPLLQE
jgi:hypothetical protein